MHPETPCSCGPAVIAHEETCPHFGQPKFVPTGKKTEYRLGMFSEGNIVFDLSVLFFFFGSLAFLAIIYWIFRNSL